jgi:hypothetical protein
VTPPFPVDRDPPRLLAHFGGAAEAFRGAKPTSRGHLCGSGERFRIGRHFNR